MVGPKQESKISKTYSNPRKLLDFRSLQFIVTLSLEKPETRLMLKQEKFWKTPKKTFLGGVLFSKFQNFQAFHAVSNFTFIQKQLFRGFLNNSSFNTNVLEEAFLKFNFELPWDRLRIPLLILGESINFHSPEIIRKLPEQKLIDFDSLKSRIWTQSQNYNFQVIHQKCYVNLLHLQETNQQKILKYTLFFIRTNKFCLRLAVLNFFSFLKLKCS